jgi:uncharacterized protein
VEVSRSIDVRRKKMPVPVSYPGVYIEEISSGVRTITGVATSITAFLGRAVRGPVDKASTIFSYGDFERQFGGLHVDCPMSYAVRDFFLNGGSQAVIVRLFHLTGADRTLAFEAANGVAEKATGNTAAAAATNAATEATKDKNKEEPRLSAAKAVADAAKEASIIEGATPKSVKDAAAKVAAGYSLFEIAVDTLQLTPVSPGSWTNQLRVKVDWNVSQDVADRYGLAVKDLFNLTITDKGTNLTEKFINVTTKDSPRRVDRVLKDESQLVRWNGDYPNPTPKTPAPKEGAKEVHDSRSDLDAALTEAALQLQKAKQDEKEAADNKLKEARQKLDDASTAVDSAPLEQKDFEGNPDTKTGLYALEDTDLFNILCIPPDARDQDLLAGVYQTALTYCVKRRAFLLVDPPLSWKQQDSLISGAALKVTELGLNGVDARNAAVFYPRVLQSDPLKDGHVSSAVPSGIIAGLMARTDAQRGIWKAPAGIDAGLNGIAGLEVTLTDGQNGTLNQVGINCLRNFPIYGRVAWGSRTLRGADQAADEYKYIPVRRTALFIEESLFRGLKWVVFEPNDEPLWAQIRLNVGAFMNNLFRQGAFQGRSPREAYFVKCDNESTTQNDINLGIVNVVVGFAPLKPAEFVIVKLQQIAGQIEV